MGPVVPAAMVFALVAGPSGLERWRPPELAVKDRAPVTEFTELRDIAFQFLGRPYRMGGVGSPSIDCSGFTCRVYAEAGYAIPRVSRDQARAGRLVDLKAIAPGDLLFFAEPGKRITHVGMYLGDGELIHASSGQGKVVVADLGARWFQQRLHSARRILTSTTTGTGTSSTTPTRPPTLPPAQTLELVEHTGDSVLPPMLRLPAMRPVPSYGPELVGAGVTSVGVRAALITERGILGLTLAPEATLRIESIALALAVAVPIRFELEKKPTVGGFDRNADYFKFLRSVSLGLRGADLELSLARLGDVTLLDGFVVDQLAPGSLSLSVPGLTLARTPLSFFGGYRSDLFEVETLVDDIFDPAIMGLGAMVPILDTPVSAGIAISTDQQAQFLGQRRALNAAELQLHLDAYETKSWTFNVRLHGGALWALGDIGIGGATSVTVQHRFGRHLLDSLSARVTTSVLGPVFLAGIMGPAYLVHRSEHLEALDRVPWRAALRGDLMLRLGQISVGAGYGDALTAGRDPLDRRLVALAEVNDIPLGGTKFLDFRLVYAARALLRDPGTLDTLHGGLRLRVRSWFHVEVYAEKGEQLEGGGGLTITWIP